MEKPRYIWTSLHLLTHLKKRVSAGTLVQAFVAFRLRSIRVNKSVTHKVHPVLSQPVEALKKKQKGEESNKAGREVISEHSECQARLRHRIPGALNEMLAVLNNGKNGSGNNSFKEGK